MRERFDNNTFEPKIPREKSPLNFLPDRIKMLIVRGTLAVSALMAIVVAAEAEEKDIESNKLQDVGHEDQVDIDELQETDEKLIFPFLADGVIVQQGWDYSGLEGIHKAIDFAKGELGLSSTWESFPVIASATGNACVNPENRIGTAIYMEHNFNGEQYWTYYGHLESVRENIDQCTSGETTFIEQGEFIGTSGDTGAEGLIHLHFEVDNANQEEVDPYGIYGSRENYPDIEFSNGNVCGPDHLWETCPTEHLDKPTVVPIIDENIEEEKIGGFFDARKMMEEWIEHMMAGRTLEAFDMQVREHEQISHIESYDVASLEQLERCSHEMRQGKFRNWNISHFEGESSGSRYAMKLQGDFDEFFAGYGRIERRYGRGYFSDYLYIIFEEDSLGKMKIAEIPICIQIGTPFGTVVSQGLED